MNRLDEPPPLWLNLQADSDVTIDLHTGPRRFHPLAATGDELARLWAAMPTVETKVDLYATRRPGRHGAPVNVDLS
jgi:hypothetical protein